MNRPRRFSEQWWRLVQLLTALGVNEAALFLAVLKRDWADGVVIAFLTAYLLVKIWDILFPD